MFNIFNIKLNKKGFTLMELVVSTAIMGTLAAFSIPAMLETQQSANKSKTIDNINIIGSSIINKYMEVAPNGSGLSAIAVFNTDLSSINPLIATTAIVFSTGDTVYYGDLFPPGKLPESPFGGGYRISGVSAGSASWTNGVLEIITNPSVTVADADQDGITVTFKP